MRLLEQGLAQAARMCESGEYDVRDMLQYGHNYGGEKLNTALARFLGEQYGQPVAPEALMVTNGASSALELSCSVLTQPGDEVLVEDPTYFLAAGVLSDHGLIMRPVATDQEGMCMDSLEAAIRSFPKAKLLYTIPAYHNPTGATLPAARRQRLAQLADQHGITILADEVYQPLGLDTSDQPGPPPILPYYTPNAISFGSFSKIVAPGLRLGWIQADPAMIVKLCLRGYIASGGGLNPFASGIIYPLLVDGSMAAHVDQVKSTLRARKAALVQALQDSLPADCKVHVPAGGYFVWVTVPRLEAATEAEHARKAFVVAYTPGVCVAARRD